MIIKENYPLKNLNSFGIPVRARKYIQVTDIGETSSIKDILSSERGKYLILGGGSNILFTRDFEGTVIHPAFNNIAIDEISEESALITAESGLEWDKFVEWTIGKGLQGIENLSYIPGNVGAAPIQNIGAYGTEVSETITKVSTTEINSGNEKVFSNKECKFGYRNSIFKNEESGKHIITKLQFRLKRNKYEFNLSYAGLHDRVNQHGKPGLDNIRNAVIMIRKEKLPEPSVTGNAGSFFKNPVIEMSQLSKISEEYPGIPSWSIGSGKYKIPAAWLIEKAGWKGKKHGQAGVHPKHALVLINLGKSKGNDIMELSKMIRESVKDIFNISLEPEVSII